MPQKRMKCFRVLLEHLALIEHQFLNGIRDLRKAGSLWGMIRGVGGVRKSTQQNWLAKKLGLGFGLLCWGFKGVQLEIPSEEASTLQIGLVAFLPGRCTNPRLHPCLRLFEQDGHQPTPWYHSYWKGSLLVALDYGRQVYFILLHSWFDFRVFLLLDWLPN